MSRRMESGSMTTSTSEEKGHARTLALMVVSAAIGGTFQYGYNLAIVNAPAIFIEAFVNETVSERWARPLQQHEVTLIWTFIVSIYSLGGLAGAILAGPMAVRYGRKKALLLGNVFLMLGALLAVTSRVAKSFEMIIISRALVGIHSGISMNVQPMYFGESAPKHLRGAATTSCAVFVALGVVTGQVVSLREILGSEPYWQYLLGSNAVPGLIQLLTLPWFPESPRYLLIDRGDQPAAVQALRRLRGCEVQQSELDEILAEEAESHGVRAQRPWELLTNRSVRWQLITVVITSSAMQLCGNDSIYFYASYVFREAAIPEGWIQYVTIGTGSCELIADVLSTLLVERRGRKQLLMGGYSSMAFWAAVFTVALSFQHTAEWLSYVSVACVFIYILSFGMGPAGVTLVLPTEIFNQASRPAACVISGSLIWLNMFLVGMVFPFLVNGLGQFCFVPFGVVCLLSAVYVGLVLPETQGKTLPMITAEFNRLNYRHPGRLAAEGAEAPHSSDL